MSAEPIREATEAERDAQILRGIREAFELSPLSLRLTGEELALVIRIADERDALRRAACEEPDSKYVVRECACCGHEPHGYLLLCTHNPCPCRDGRPKP